MFKDSIKVGICSDDVKQQEGYFQQRLLDFIHPLVDRLDRQVDRRVVNTFTALLTCLIRFRRNNLGLVLSELGGKQLGEAQPPAGTKRISNLLRSKRWLHTLLETYLLEKAQRTAQSLHQSGQGGVLLWDESVVKSRKVFALRACVPSEAAKPNGSSVSNPVFLIRPVDDQYMYLALSGWACCWPGLRPILPLLSLNAITTTV